MDEYLTIFREMISLRGLTDHTLKNYCTYIRAYLDYTVVIRLMMNIQLTVDHRLIDGLLAAKFVGYMKELLENPIKILV